MNKIMGTIDKILTFCFYKKKRILFFLPKGYIKKKVLKLYKTINLPVVLMFHSIVPNAENASYSITPEKLEETVICFKNLGFSFLFEDEYKKTDDKAVILTFDDGFTNNYYYAFPILKKHNVKASINLITDKISNSNKDQYLSKSLIQELSDSGLIQFQAHTCSHPHLTKCSDEELKIEIEECRFLLKELGLNTTVFVYPGCKINKKVSELTKQHYSLAYGGPESIWQNEIEFHYRIPRIEIDMSFNEKKLLIETLYYYYLLKKNIDIMAICNK